MLLTKMISVQRNSLVAFVVESKNIPRKGSCVSDASGLKHIASDNDFLDAVGSEFCIGMRFGFDSDAAMDILHNLIVRKHTQKTCQQLSSSHACCPPLVPFEKTKQQADGLAPDKIHVIPELICRRHL